QGFDAFEAALRRELGLGPNDTLDSIRAAACAEGACDEAGLRAAVAAMTLSKRITDQKRGTIIAAWLEDPGLRGESFGDYLGAFFTQEGERFVRGTITKKLAEDHPAVAQALSDEAARHRALGPLQARLRARPYPHRRGAGHQSRAMGDRASHRRGIFLGASGARRPADDLRGRRCEAV